MAAIASGGGGKDLLRMQEAPGHNLQGGLGKTSRRDHYLFQPIQGIVELPLPLQGQQPHLLPARRQLIDPGVLCLRLGEDWHWGRGRLAQGFSWNKGKEEYSMRELLLFILKHDDLCIHSQYFCIIFLHGLFVGWSFNCNEGLSLYLHSLEYPNVIKGERH